MDRLTVMRSLVTVARAGSFNGAARSLGISGSLVSRHIAHLEEELGIVLVNRTARAVHLTEAGNRYMEFASRILAEVAEEDAAIGRMRERPEGALNVVSPKWIGSLDLGDAIAQFAVEHPRILVRYEVGGMSERTHDFIHSGYDVAFHTKNLRDSSVKVKLVTRLKFALCASPGYLAGHCPLADPRELTSHKCLVHVNDPAWTFEFAGRLEHVKPVPAFTGNTYLVLQKATLRGLGVGLLPLRAIHDDIATGRLRLLLPEHVVPERPLFAVYAPGGPPLRRVRVFLDFIEEWFKQHPLPQTPRPPEGAPERAHPHPVLRETQRKASPTAVLAGLQSAG